MLYEKVEQYCALNQITIKAFEQMCGLSNGTVRAWRVNRNNPRLETLQKLEKGTGIPIVRWIK